MVNKFEEGGMPIITCAKCNKPVDMIAVRDSIERDEKIYMVVCHGEKETTILAAKDIMESHSISGGIAFVSKPAIEAKL